MLVFETLAEVSNLIQIFYGEIPTNKKNCVNSEGAVSHNVTFYAYNYFLVITVAVLSLARNPISPSQRQRAVW